MAKYKVKCANCGKQRIEEAMIYDVFYDEYFCDQLCKDEYFEVERKEENNDDR